MKIFSSRSMRDESPHKPPHKLGGKNDAAYDDYEEDDFVPVRKSPTKKILLVLLILVALGMGLWAMANSFIKPPQIVVDTPESAVVGGESGDITAPNVQGNAEIDPDAPVAILGERVSDYFTFLVAVTDIDGTRTDNIMVGAFDTQTADTTVNLMNIPRDTMSVCSRTGASRKINAAYSGGINRTLSEVRNIIGFTPDRYIVLSFDGVAAIVDAIGGVEYDVPFRMKYDDPYQDLHIDLQAGVQTLNGEQAVDFLRWRKNNYEYRDQVPDGYDGSDESRIDKQQEFIQILAEQVLHIRNTFNVNAIVQAVFDNMDTNFEMGEILWMATKGLNMSTDNINMMTLPGYADYAYAGTEDKYSFYFPSYYNTLDMVNAYLNPYENPITSINVYSSPVEEEQIPEELPEEEALDEGDIGTILPEEVPVVQPAPQDYTMDEFGFLMDAEGNPAMNEDGTQMHITQLAPEAPEEQPESEDEAQTWQPPAESDAQTPTDIPMDIPTQTPTDIPTQVPTDIPISNQGVVW